MQLYELTYSLQNEVSPKSCLKEFCDETESCGGNNISIKSEFPVGKKTYLLPEDGDIVKEKFSASPYYIISSFSVILFAIKFLFTGFELNSIDMIWYAPLVIGALGVLINPYLMMKHQPSEFYPESESLFGLSRLRPLPFQQHMKISVIVYLTTLAVGVVLLPVVFPDPNVLAAIFPVSITAVFLAWQDGYDPASNTITVITILTLLPFAIPLINLGMYSQRSISAQQNMQILQYLTPDAFNQINQAVAPIIQSETLWLLATNLMIIISIILVMKLITGGAGKIEVYKLPHSVSDKKHLRVGISILFIIYVGGSIGLWISQLIGYPIVPVEAVFDRVLIYWPLYILVPIWFFMWLWNPWGDSIDTPIDVSESAFEVDGVPVLFRDLGDTAALPKSGDKPAIVLHKQFKQDLTDDEIQAICYHELYHIKHNSIKYQTWIDIPVIGYLLFLFRTNFSELFNEEYAADEFAAANVGTEAVVSALTTVESMNIGRGGSPIQNHTNKGWQGYIQLLFSPPVLSLYSPPRHHRITRLEDDVTPE